MKKLGAQYSLMTSILTWRPFPVQKEVLMYLSHHSHFHCKLISKVDEAIRVIFDFDYFCLMENRTSGKWGRPGGGEEEGINKSLCLLR